MNIIQIFASPVWGGGEQYIYDLAVASTSHRHAVTFFSRKSSVIAQRVAGIDGEYYQLPFKGIIDFYSVIRLSKYLKSHPTDIIHIHCFVSHGKACCSWWVSMDNAHNVIPLIVAS